MILCINRQLNIHKETDGTYSFNITGMLNVSHVSMEKTPKCRYYLLYEHGYLFIIQASDGKMILRGEIKSKDCLKDNTITANWNIYNPPVKKSYYY